MTDRDRFRVVRVRDGAGCPWAVVDQRGVASATRWLTRERADRVAARLNGEETETERAVRAMMGGLADQRRGIRR